MYIFLTSGVKLHIHLLNVAVQFIVFLILSTLICRGTDISKYFSESLGIRDNESRLYFPGALLPFFTGTCIATHSPVKKIAHKTFFALNVRLAITDRLLFWWPMFYC